MKPYHVLVTSMIGKIVFDIVGSFASRLFGFQYSSLIVFTLLIYLAAGVFAARYGNLLLSVLAGAATGLADSTVGWLISAIIGPGAVNIPGGTDEAGIAGLAGIVITIILVTFLATGVGLVGGLICWVWQHRTVPKRLTDPPSSAEQAP